ncbi:hypothetical protein HYY71_05425 [Candidatus Woesearchaeota archaeon]|nr:hypothetical protein [Candidatus Woesearchaeota archaeon]
MTELTTRRKFLGLTGTGIAAAGALRPTKAYALVNGGSGRALAVDRRALVAGERTVFVYDPVTLARGQDSGLLSLFPDSTDELAGISLGERRIIGGRTPLTDPNATGHGFYFTDSRFFPAGDFTSEINALVPEVPDMFRNYRPPAARVSHVKLRLDPQNPTTAQDILLVWDTNGRILRGDANQIYADIRAGRRSTLEEITDGAVALFRDDWSTDIRGINVPTENRVDRYISARFANSEKKYPAGHIEEELRSGRPRPFVPVDNIDSVAAYFQRDGFMPPRRVTTLSFDGRDRLYGIAKSISAPPSAQVRADLTTFNQNDFGLQNTTRLRSTDVYYLSPIDGRYIERVRRYNLLEMGINHNVRRINNPNEFPGEGILVRPLLQGEASDERTAAITYFAFNTDGSIKSAEIAIDPFYVPFRPNDSGTFAIYLHEFLHALGWFGHTDLRTGSNLMNRFVDINTIPAASGGIIDAIVRLWQDPIGTRYKPNPDADNYHPTRMKIECPMVRAY